MIIPLNNFTIKNKASTNVFAQTNLKSEIYYKHLNFSSKSF